MAAVELSFRDGSAADLQATFELAEHAARVGVDGTATLVDQEREWRRRRPFVEFLAAQPGTRYVVCEDEDGPAGYARVIRYEGFEQLSELFVRPDRQGSGIGRRLLELVWPGDPTATLGRVTVTTGAPGDLTLYLGSGVMPVSGHWQLSQRAESYLARRSLEADATGPAVHVLKPDRAVAEWKRLEPPAVRHDRPALHEFFARGRTCLALMDPAAGGAAGLCWVSSEGEIGPAVAATPGQLAPVVLAALDRVAMTQQPEHLDVSVSTLSWWLLRRLHTLGFAVGRPSWVLASHPLPGLDRYAPARPPHVL